MNQENQLLGAVRHGPCLLQGGVGLLPSCLQVLCQIIKVATTLALVKIIQTRLTHKFADHFDRGIAIRDVDSAAGEDYLRLQGAFARLLDPYVGPRG